MPVKHLILLAVLALSGCSGWAPVEDRNDSNRPSTHVVKRGENLFRIAWRYGLDYRDVARWNKLASPDRILAGQRLRLTPPGSSSSRSDSPRSDRITLAAKPATPAPNPTRTKPSSAMLTAPSTAVKPKPTRTRNAGPWEWPTQGTVVKSFNPKALGGKGIQIGVNPGQSVKAASGGEIVYKGSGLSGYGRLIIVQHSASLLSAYGYLGRIFVQEGDSVRKGQVIAEMDAGSASQSVLHFEVRKNGRPVNPLQYLSS